MSSRAFFSNKDFLANTFLIRSFLYGMFAVLCFVVSASETEAATLRLSPDTGVYTAGSTFTARVTIDTGGKPVNAAEGTLSFNPRELSVVSVSRSSSIFNLWTQEPTYSNGAGTVSFGGGSPSGYSGSAGTVITVVFRAPSAGNPKVSFTNGSVLAADGLGTNILTSMKGGSYTISAPTIDPEPEYIAPANTPQAPQVSSRTHPDAGGWYASTVAELSWDLPSGVTGVRTLLDESAGTIPTKVYEDPISSISIEDLPEGISYFHIQFRNSEGWGRVTHRRIAVDTQPPSSFTITKSEITEEHREQALIFDVADISPVTRYKIQLDGGEPFDFTDEEGSGYYKLPDLNPGHHTIIAEAYDSAGNSLISTFSFDIEAFEAPVFTDYPARLGNGVIPVFKGTTRPDASVQVTIRKTTGEEQTYTVSSNADGDFTVIPASSFELGVYDMTAVATDPFGAMSSPSEPARFIVEEPGYLRIGTFVVSVLSVIVPLVALLIILIFGLWYLWHRLLVWRRRILKETREAEHKLASEFDTLAAHLSKKVEELKSSRKGKLTKAEESLINEIRADLSTARKSIQKEISDIDDVVE